MSRFCAIFVIVGLLKLANTMFVDREDLVTDETWRQLLEIAREYTDEDKIRSTFEVPLAMELAKFYAQNTFYFGSCIDANEVQIIKLNEKKQVKIEDSIERVALVLPQIAPNSLNQRTIPLLMRQNLFVETIKKAFTRSVSTIGIGCVEYKEAGSSEYDEKRCKIKPGTIQIAFVFTFVVSTNLEVVPFTDRWHYNEEVKQLCCKQAVYLANSQKQQGANESITFTDFGAEYFEIVNPRNQALMANVVLKAIEGFKSKLQEKVEDTSKLSISAAATTIPKKLFYEMQLYDMIDVYFVIVWKFNLESVEKKLEEELPKK